MFVQRPATVSRCLVLTYAAFYFSGLIQNGQAAGTTRNLEQIFIGRCWDLQHVLMPDIFSNEEKNCVDLWSNFTLAFAYKEPCSTTSEDYRNFVELATHNVIPDESLFWENVYPFVNEYSSKGKRYTTIVDTLLGYMADNVYWCGQLEDPGINYEYCPTQEECQNDGGQMPDESYWQIASEHFSAETSGKSSVLLNGSHPVPFSPNSTFAKHELINLTPENNVSQLHIMVLHDLGGLITENCGEGSIADLEDRARGQGLIVMCENDPPSVRYLQCADAPTAAECPPTAGEGRPVVSKSARWSSRGHLSLYTLLVGCIVFKD